MRAEKKSSRGAGAKAMRTQRQRERTGEHIKAKHGRASAEVDREQMKGAERRTQHGRKW